MMYEQIISQITNESPSPTSEYASNVKCDNMNEFIHTLRKATQEEGLTDQTIYIVIIHIHLPIILIMYMWYIYNEYQTILVIGYWSDIYIIFMYHAISF